MRYYIVPLFSRFGDSVGMSYIAQHIPFGARVRIFPPMEMNIYLCALHNL